MIMDPCNMTFTLSILSHITNKYLNINGIMVLILNITVSIKYDINTLSCDGELFMQFG